MMELDAPTHDDLESASETFRIAYNSIARWWGWWHDQIPDLNGFQGVSFAMRDYADMMRTMGYNTTQIATTLRGISDTFLLPKGTPAFTRDLLIAFAVRNQPY